MDFSAECSAERKPVPRRSAWSADRWLKPSLWAASLLPVVGNPAQAQETSELFAPRQQADAVVSGTIVYGQEHFVGYSVQNAQDMLRLVPGVASILASLGGNSEKRGIGSGGDQILVNGRRFPGKSNDISKVLARLRADSIERIELIRGAHEGIDIRSDGLVVNIVMREGASLGGGGTFEIAGRGNDKGSFTADGLASYSSSIGALGYTLGIERATWSPSQTNNARWTNRHRDEVYYRPDGQIQELRPQNWSREFDRWAFTAGLTYDVSSSVRVQLNGLYQTQDATELNLMDLTRFNAAGDIVDQYLDLQGQRKGLENTWEVSGELTSPLWGGDLTALVLANSDKRPSLDDRERTIDGATRPISRTLITARQDEYIARVQYSFGLDTNLSLSIGSEVSYNRLQQDLVSELDLDDNGQLERINVPAANALVEEDRGEVFFETRWFPPGSLSVYGALNYEWSTLSTNSPFNPGRSLQYLKPRLDIRRQFGSQGQFRFLVERQISQLDFDNFVPSYNVLDDRIDAGNPGLLPEQVWRFETVYEHRLAADAGVIEGKLFYESIANAIDFIPLQQGATLVSAQGNLGDAWRYGFEMNASVRLGMIGLRDAMLTTNAKIQDSQVTDPFTLQPRRFREDAKFEYSIRFRHDVRSLDLSYGFDYENRGRPRDQSNLFSRDLVRGGETLSAFAEKRLSPRLSLRAEAQNLHTGNQGRDRIFFTTNQIDGEIRRLGSYRETRDLRYAISLKGNF
ncbi:MAG TPA: outer membrane beta-barrel protein [Sphingobium sp.]|nr:outer membrane beta-barrel protein [Sphingobium sp.]